jgi:hypothetical protein
MSSNGVVDNARELELRQLLTMYNGRYGIVPWTKTSNGHDTVSFPTLGIRMMHCTWKAADGCEEYGGFVEWTSTGRTIWVKRDADPMKVGKAIITEAVRPFTRLRSHATPATLGERPSARPKLTVIEGSASEPPNRNRGMDEFNQRPHLRLVS